MVLVGNEYGISRWHSVLIASRNRDTDEDHAGYLGSILSRMKKRVADLEVENEEQDGVPTTPFVRHERGSQRTLQGVCPNEK